MFRDPILLSLVGAVAGLLIRLIPVRTMRRGLLVIGVAIGAVLATVSGVPHSWIPLDPLLNGSPFVILWAGAVIFPAAASALLAYAALGAWLNGRTHRNDDGSTL